jgi:tetratricopeptide (TPR) repeat protein
MQPLYRDIAAVLRESQPEGGIVLLANPNASAGISYFGRFQTLGTLFWENAPGLKAAAAIFSARSDDDAARLIRARGVTHIAMISATPFLAEYFRLLHPEAPLTGLKLTFGHRLTQPSPGIPWLQPVAYRRPQDLEASAVSVALFKVDFQQNAVERLYHSATALAAGGESAGGEKLLDEALALAPAPERFALCESAGAAFYDFGHDAAAVRIFRRALAFNDDAGVATTVAWILATSSNDSLRDGIAALALVHPIAQNEPDDPTVLSALGAAHAELGQFPQAVSAAERALAIVRASGDRSAESLLQKRLAAYRANRPWRQ